MMPIIARWTILEGKRDAAIAALRELEREVYEQEPFVPMYTINVPDFSVTSFPTPAPTEVVFLSIFDDYEAFQKHLNGPVFQGWLARYKDLFLTNNGNLFVMSTWLKRVAGYIRPSLTAEQEAHA